MNPDHAYRQHQSLGWTRIDLLLALFDGAVGRLEQAAESLAQDDSATAAPHVLRSQRIVTELIAGLDMRYGEIPRNLHNLYSFVLRSISRGTPEDIEAALRVLRTIREGFVGIRAEALQLERSGAIPPTASTQSLSATA